MSPPRRLSLWPVVLLLGLGAFGFGLVRLFQLRFEAGDIYAPYSTLRSDALGARALHDALAELPGLRVERNLRPLRRLFAPPFSLGGAPAAPVGAAGPGATTLFYLAVDPARWPFILTGAEADELEGLARRGTRVVLTFLPTNRPPTLPTLRRLREEQEREVRQRERERRQEQAGDDADQRDAKGLPPEILAQLSVDAAARWGVDFYRVPVDAKGDPPRGATPTPAVSLGTPAVPAEIGAETLSWHSAVDLDVKPAGSVWRPIVSRNRGRAVLAERPFGQGSLVLATDSFFLSNEALRDERHPALLAWLVGPRAGRVVFDERHLGLGEDPGMMTLARRYRLGPVLAALGLLVGLFLWRSATSLAPPRAEAPPEAAGAETVAGREASAGFLSLLRRSVPAAELIPTCLARWEAAHGRPVSAARVARLREIAAAEKKRPAAAYRAMREALRKG